MTASPYGLALLSRLTASPKMKRRSFYWTGNMKRRSFRFFKFRAESLLLACTHTHAHARARTHTHTHTHTPHIQVLKCVGVCLSLQNAIRKAHNASRKGRLRRGSRIGTPVYVTSSYTYVTSPEKRFWSWKPTSHGPAKTCGRTCHMIIHTCHIITGLRRPPEVVRGMGPGGNRGKRCSLSPIPGSSAARRRRTVGPAAL